MKKMNNKGFAVTGILYTLLVLFLALMLGLITVFSNRKNILNKLKDGVVDSYGFYPNGTVIYYNPVANSRCSESEANENVNDNGTSTEIKTGCMKWYTFNDKGESYSKINMILDHNTTAVVAWNDNQDGLLSPTTVLNQLKNDTSSWNTEIIYSNYSVDYSSDSGANYTIDYSGYKARLITAEEIASITNNNSFNPQSSYYYFFDSNTYNSSDLCKSGNITGCNYAWLYSLTDSCKNYGCFEEDNTLYSYVNNTTRAIAGYWTATSCFTNKATTKAWAVHSMADLSNASVLVSDVRAYGVRPVIQISKNILK